MKSTFYIAEEALAQQACQLLDSLRRYDDGDRLVTELAAANPRLACRFDGHRADDPASFAADVPLLWALSPAPLLVRKAHHSELTLLLDPEWHTCYDEMQAFFRFVLDGLGASLIDAPANWTAATLDLSELLASCPRTGFNPVRGTDQHHYRLLLTIQEGGLRRRASIDEQLTLLNGLVTSGLATWSNLETECGDDQADGRRVVGNIYQLNTLKRGIGPYRWVGYTLIYDPTSPLLRLAHGYLSHYLARQESGNRLSRLFVMVNEFGLAIDFCLEIELDCATLARDFQHTGLFSALERLLCAAGPGSEFHCDTYGAIKKLSYQLAPGLPDVGFDEQATDQGRWSCAMVDYKLGTSVSILYRILLAEGLLEERMPPGSNKPERFVSLKGRRYGWNAPNDKGSTTPYWFDDTLEELKSRYFSAEAIAACKKASKESLSYKGHRELHTLSKLLERNSIGLSAVKANQLLQAAGLLETRQRFSSRNGELKSYKALTRAGELYGQNRRSPMNNETQPYYYADTFEELVSIVLRASRS